MLAKKRCPSITHQSSTHSSLSKAAYQGSQDRQDRHMFHHLGDQLEVLLENL